MSEKSNNAVVCTASRRLQASFTLAGCCVKRAILHEKLLEEPLKIYVQNFYCVDKDGYVSLCTAP